MVMCNAGLRSLYATEPEKEEHEGEKTLAPFQNTMLIHFQFLVAEMLAKHAGRGAVTQKDVALAKSLREKTNTGEQENGLGDGRSAKKQRLT
jgi:hypothetical protein